MSAKVLNLRQAVRVAALVLLCLATALQVPLRGQEAGTAKGLVIHRHSPSSSDRLAEATEYVKVERFGQVTNLIPVGGGPQIRIFNDRLVEIVEYADLTSGTITTDAQIAELKSKPAALGVLAKKYPKAHDLLAVEARRINAAVQMFGQSKVLVAGRWQEKAEMSAQSASTGESLTVTTEDGQSRTYTGVKVAGQDPDALRIMHSGGAASIPFEQLGAADRTKYGFDPVKAAEYRKQKEMASKEPPAPTPQENQTELSEEELIAQFQKQYPDKQYVEIYSMAREVISERKKAASEARMAAEYPSYAKLIEGIEEGVSTRKTDTESFNRISKLLAEEAPPSGRQPVLEKGKLYMVSDENGTFSIGQRMDDLILAKNVDGIPFAIVQLPDPSLLDGVRLSEGPLVRCVGTYKGDQGVTMVTGAEKTFPLFQASLIAGLSVTGGDLITVRFPALIEEGDEGL